MILNWSKNSGFYHNSHLHKIPTFHTHKNNYNWINRFLRGALFKLLSSQCCNNSHGSHHTLHSSHLIILVLIKTDYFYWEEYFSKTLT